MKQPFVSALCVGVAMCVLAPSAAVGEPPAASIAADQSVPTIVDQPLAEFRWELLDAAYSAASAMPLKPHVKDRSRAQTSVAEVCFELEQPQKALKFVEGIANWERGAGYADFAFYCVQRGDARDVRKYLEMARQIAAGEEDWRRDVVMIKVARTLELLGQSQQATELEAGVVNSEIGKLDVVRASQVGDAEFDKQFGALSETLAGGIFDRMRNALDACMVLLDRFYDNTERRELILKRITFYANQMPPSIRIDLQEQIAECAIRHNDPQTAGTAIKEVQYLVEHYGWLPESRVPLLARVSMLQAMAGDRVAARKSADDAIALFSAERDRIESFDRAEALLPIAEAFQALGDSAVALATYKRAVAEGSINPNARPRAEDLTATCISMAKSVVEPDAELWASMRQMREGLVDPW